MFFLELSCFFYDPMDVGNLISGSSDFSKCSLNWNSQFMYRWNLTWRILSIILPACADDTTLMAESEEELKSLLMKVKVETEKVG